MKINIHQIYYNEETKGKLVPEFTPYYNKDCSLFFESEVIRDLIEQRKHEESYHFGVVGPKFKYKLNHWSRRYDSKIYQGFKVFKNVISNSNCDVVSLMSIRNDNPIRFAQRVHPGFEDIMRDLLRIVNFDVKFKRIENSIYCNFFTATPEFWDHYTQELMFPVMDVISDRNHPVCGRIYQDANYQKTLPKEMQDKYGIKHFPFHPFITERLPNIFLMKYSKYKVNAYSRLQ